VLVSVKVPCNSDDPSGFGVTDKVRVVGSTGGPVDGLVNPDDPEVMVFDEV